MEFRGVGALFVLSVRNTNQQRASGARCAVIRPANIIIWTPRLAAKRVPSVRDVQRKHILNQELAISIIVLPSVEIRP